MGYTKGLNPPNYPRAPRIRMCEGLGGRCPREARKGKKLCQQCQVAETHKLAAAAEAKAKAT